MEQDPRYGLSIDLLVNGGSFAKATRSQTNDSCGKTHYRPELRGLTDDIRDVDIVGFFVFAIVCFFVSIIKQRVGKKTEPTQKFNFKGDCP